MKHVSIISPTYNEEENVSEVVAQVQSVMGVLSQYTYEHIFIDNASLDGTVGILRGIAERDPHVRVIVNVRNFGHIRSPYYGLLQADGDAVILLAADLQDPPSLIPQLLQEWERGFSIVAGVKSSSGESRIFFILRKAYYRLITRISMTELIENFTGFGLYDKRVITILRTIGDPYPYFRGLISELGFPVAKVPYSQPARKRGITKNNFYTLYDIAMLGITSHSKVPLRLATMLGFLLSMLSILVACGYFVAKLLFWNIFSAGMAPLIIGGFTLLSVQMLFIGIIGEYVAAIHTQILHRPLVVEKERINFPRIEGNASTKPVENRASYDVV